MQQYYRLYIVIVKYEYTEFKTNALFRCLTGDEYIQVNEDQPIGIFTIVWQPHTQLQLTIDSLPYTLHANSLLAISPTQHLSFEPDENTVLFQFNREFYCIIDHDKEVSCSGVLFLGTKGAVFLTPDEKDTRKIEAILPVFYEEFCNEDNVQGEMLRILLKRVIIILTRMAKKQLYDELIYTETDLDLSRQFNTLLEFNFRKKHKVADYAEMLNKSPKTLSNVFKQFHHKTPLQMIHERLELEAKRLLRYTDKSTKEIAYELGFDDASKFSRFFKTQTGMYPTAFKETMVQLV